MHLVPIIIIILKVEIKQRNFLNLEYCRTTDFIYESPCSCLISYSNSNKNTYDFVHRTIKFLLLVVNVSQDNTSVTLRYLQISMDNSESVSIILVHDFLIVFDIV